MLFYVPPLLPVLSSAQDGDTQRVAGDLFSSLESARLPVRYLANMLAAGNDEPVISAYNKMIAVRLFKRAKSVGDVSNDRAAIALAGADLTPQAAEQIYCLTSLPTFNERFVIPPMGREMSIEVRTNPQQYKGETGFGTLRPPKRGW